MRTKQFFQAIAFPLLLGSSALSQTTQLYRAFLPLHAICGSAAPTMAAEFARQTQLRVVDAHCVPAGASAGPTVMITYEAPRAVYPEPFVIGGDPIITDTVAIGSGDAPAYATYKHCEGDLSAQVKLFTEQTGQAPLAAYCLTGVYGETSATMHLDTFQKSTKAVFTMRAFNGTANAADLAAVKQMIQADGGAVALYDDGKFFFYDFVAPVNTAARVKLTSATALIADSHAECMAQRAGLVQIMKRYGSRSVVACTRTGAYAGPTDPFSGSVVEVVGSDLNRWTFGEAATLGYRSAAECEYDKARVIAEAAARSPSVVGGICGFTGRGRASDYNVTLVYRH